MKTLSAYQFGVFASSMSDVVYKYEAFAQPDFTPESTLRFQLVFKNVLVFLNPNCICFTGEDGNLVFERVKRVVLCAKNDTFPVSIRIICGDREADRADQTYLISCGKIFSKNC